MSSSLVADKKFSFPKKRRLLSSHQFRRVARYGRQIFGQHLALQIYEHHASPSKIGISVSRKFGTAVQRNRLKRLVREAFRLSQDLLPHHLHINVRPVGSYSGPLSLHIIQNELLALCNRPIA